MVQRIWTFNTKPRMSRITPSAIIEIPPSRQRSTAAQNTYWLGFGRLHCVTLGLAPA